MISTNESPFPSLGGLIVPGQPVETALSELKPRFFVDLPWAGARSKSATTWKQNSRKSSPRLTNPLLNTYYGWLIAGGG